MRKSIVFLALLCVIASFTSCSKPGEATVEKYFTAMKMDDKDTMGSMAIEPKDLEFKSFEITAIGEPEESELELPKLEQKMASLNKKRQDLVNAAMDAKDEWEELKDELEETRRASRKAELKKEIEEAEAVYKEEEEKFKGLVKKLNSLKKQITREKELIGMSTAKTENISMYSGKTFKMKADVKVTLLDGSVGDYVFLMRRNELALKNMPDKVIGGRLVITKIFTTDEYQKYLQEQEEEKAQTEEVAEEPPAEQKEAEEGKTE